MSRELRAVTNHQPTCCWPVHVTTPSGRPSSFPGVDLSLVFVVLAVFVGEASGACQEPAMAVPVEQRQKIEGEVQAGVALVRGGASGSKEQSVAWQANLPSQSVLDAHWSLYLLCVEYEAGRLPKDAYCEAQSGVWEQISGRPIPVAGCLSDEPVIGVSPRVAAEPGPTVSPESNAAIPTGLTSAITSVPAPVIGEFAPPIAEPFPPNTGSSDVVVLPSINPPVADLAALAPTAAIGGSTPQSAGAMSQRWLSTDERYRGLEVFGPIPGESGEHPWWVATNGTCLSFLAGPSGSMTEVMLVDRLQCTAWRTVSISTDGSIMKLTADGNSFSMESVSPPAADIALGVWRAELHGRIPPKVRPLSIEFTEGDAAVLWGLTGCSSTWKVQEKNEGESSFRESAYQLRCMNGAAVDVAVLSQDTLLVHWTNLGIQLWGLARR